MDRAGLVLSGKPLPGWPRSGAAPLEGVTSCPALLSVPEPFLNVLLRSSVPQELVLQFRVTGDCVLQQSRWVCQRAPPLPEASVLGMWVATFSPCFLKNALPTLRMEGEIVVFFALHYFPSVVYYT